MQCKCLQLIVILFFSCLLSKSVFCNLPKSKILKCAVCNSLVYEIKKAVLEVDPRKTVEVGSFRINPDGQQKRVTRKYAGSETHVTELLEKICEEFKDYAQARHKETNQVEVIKLVEDGKMNPRFSEYEMIQDPELNKGVQFHCESIVEDFEDDIMDYFVNSVSEDELRNEEELKQNFCRATTKICEDVKEEL